MSDNLDFAAIRARADTALAAMHDAPGYAVSDVAVDCFNSSRDVPGLLDRIAAAEARGYDRAIATLRDESAFGRWRTARFLAHRDDPDYVTPTRGDQAADYLESLKETNDAV